MELSSPRLKNSCIFFPKKVFLVFQEMELSSPRLKKFLTFQEETFQDQKIKKTHSEILFIFCEMEPSSPRLKNILYFFKKKFFLYFSGGRFEPKKQKFLIFFQKINSYI